MLAMKKQVPPHNTETTALKPSMKKEKDSMIYYKAIFIYMLGGLVGTLWETILNLCRGRGFVFLASGQRQNQPAYREAIEGYGRAVSPQY